MNRKKRTYVISFLVLIVCLLTAGIIYVYTGNIIIAIFIAPPVIHWILQRKNLSEE